MMGRLGAMLAGMLALASAALAQPAGTGAVPQSGSYLVLGIDMAGVVEARMDSLSDDIRARLQTARMRFPQTSATADSVTVKILDPAQRAAAEKILQDIADPQGNTPVDDAYTVTSDGAGNFTLRLSDATRQKLLAEILGQSVEVVRRQAAGHPDVMVGQAGDNAIRLDGPAQGLGELKHLLTDTVDLSFRVVDESGNVPDAIAGKVPADDELLWQTGKDGKDVRQLLVQRQVRIASNRIDEAGTDFDTRTMEPIVTFRFDARGRTEFAALTMANVGKRFAIVLNGKVIFAPVIREPVLGGTGQISGTFTVETANDLANRLNASALPSLFTVVEDHIAP